MTIDEIREADRDLFFNKLNDNRCPECHSHHIIEIRWCKAYRYDCDGPCQEVKDAHDGYRPWWAIFLDLFRDRYKKPFEICVEHIVVNTCAECGWVED